MNLRRREVRDFALPTAVGFRQLVEPMGGAHTLRCATSADALGKWDAATRARQLSIGIGLVHGTPMGHALQAVRLLGC